MGGVGAYLYSTSQVPIYQAKASLLVQRGEGSGFTPGTSSFVVNEEQAVLYTRMLTEVVSFV